MEAEAEMEMQQIRQFRQVTAQTCLYMQEHCFLPQQQLYLDLEREIRKDNF